MYLLGAIILTIVLLFVINKYRPEAPLSEKLKEYKYLSEGPIESDNYEIIKIIDNWKGRAEVDGIVFLEAIFYDTTTKNILFCTNPKEYEKIDDEWENKIPYQIFWKMNDHGRVIDSIKIDYSLGLNNSGVFFHDDYFIDWVNNNNKTKQKYIDVIEGDSLSIQQLESHINRANMLYANKDYENEITNLFLKEKEGWTRIKSKKLYEKTEPIYGQVLMYTLKPYIENYKKRFIELDIAKGELEPIQIEHFVKKSKQSKSLADINNHGRSGWGGIGYFKLNHNSESINFKGHAFNRKLDRTYIYYPIEKDQDFLIMYLHKRASDNRHFKNTGIYVLRKK